MNIKIQTESRRDPLGLSEATSVAATGGSSIAAAVACKGYIFDDIGISASSSSGANAGDSTTGDFLIDSNKMPVWVWIVAVVAILFLIARRR